MKCVGLLLLVVSVLAGCSSDSGARSTTRQATPSGAYYQAVLSAARAIAASPYQQGILADGLVSRQEYEEAFSKFADCMKNRGFPIDLESDAYGRMNYSSAGAPGVSEADSACSKDTINGIAALYNDFVANPEGVDPDQLTLACLKRHKVAGDGVTVEEFKRAQADNSAVLGPANAEVMKCATDPNR